MKKYTNLRGGTFLILEGTSLLISLLQQVCNNGQKCICFLNTLTKEELVQNLLEKQANLNLGDNLTMENYRILVKSMQDVYNWSLNIEKFKTLTKTNNKINKLKPDYVFIELEPSDKLQKQLKAIAEKYQIVIILFTSKC